MKQLFFLIISTFWVFYVEAQTSTLVPLHDINHHAVDRYEIKSSNFKHIHSQLKPLNRADVAHWVTADSGTAEISILNLSTIERDYLRNDNNDDNPLITSSKPIFKVFYRTPAHLFEIRKKHFYFNLNPLLHLEGGYENYNGQGNALFLNRRGIALRGHIDNRVYFYTDIIESQARFPTYVENRITAESAIPGAGFYKQYDSRFTPQPDDGFDYLLAQGYIGFNATKHIGFQMGHGRNFIGDGHRSLFLSDFSNNHFYLKINTRVWRIHYQNLFAELIQNYNRGADQVLPKKYLAAHYLSINILKNLNIGIFEATVFGRENGFELQYLNPLIFYRAVEQGLGSPDNVILGMSWKYNFLKRFSFYGQLVLDEFVFNELFVERRGWWSNKYGLQAGLKYVDVAGIDHLDLQLEYNTVRPYTYTFRDSTANYTHYNQPLAHPLGANFKEFIAIVRYQPVRDIFVRAQMNYAVYGLDTLGSNWGTNVHTSYNTFEQEYGNKTGQGVKTQSLSFLITATYQIKHNIFLDLKWFYRNENAELDLLDNRTNTISLGMRWNMFNRLLDF